MDAPPALALAGALHATANALLLVVAWPTTAPYVPPALEGVVRAGALVSVTYGVAAALCVVLAACGRHGRRDAAAGRGD